MLSGETTIGKYPIRCVEQLVDIARASERVPGLSFVQKLTPDSDKQQIAHFAVQLAESISAKGTVVITYASQEELTQIVDKITGGDGS